MPTATPMSSTMDEVALLIGTQWATTWSSPNVPATVLSASSSGIPAATSEPNTTRRITTVSGSEMNSERLKSFWMPWSTATARLRSPACATLTCGWRCATASTAWTAAS
ncbi:UNVERIFIED_ORG: hypothetical protein FHR35_000373 [Microbispora rosea subsp. rosea]